MASLENTLMFMFLFFMLIVGDIVVASHAMIISRNAVKKTDKKGETELLIASIIGYFIVVAFSVYILWSFFKGNRQYLWKTLIAMAVVSLVPMIFIIMGWKEMESSDDYQYNTKYKTDYNWMMVLGFTIPVLVVVLALMFSRMRTKGKQRKGRATTSTPNVQTIDLSAPSVKSASVGAHKRVVIDF